jgi:hypothetical protein
MLCRHRRGWSDLCAVVTVGGGASIPLVNERLSVHTRRPVVSPSQPAFAAAAGALMLASRGEEVDIRTRTSIGLLAASSGSDIIELPAGDLLVIDEEALTDRELAWSQTEYPGDIRVPYTPEAFDEDSNPGWSMRLNVIHPPRERPLRRLRFSQFVVGMCALVAMTAVGGVAYTLTGIENHQAPPVPTVAPVPLPPVSSLVPSPAPPPPTAVPPPPTAVPVPSSVAPPPPPPPEPPSPPPPPPPPPVVVTTQPPPVHTTHRPPPPPQTTTPPPPPTTAMTTPTTEPPPPPTTTPTTTTTVPMTTQWIHVPLLPVPIPIQVPASQAPANQAPQYPAPAQQYPGQYPGGGYGGGYPGGGYAPNPFLGPGY